MLGHAVRSRGHWCGCLPRWRNQGDVRIACLRSVHAFSKSSYFPQCTTCMTQQLKFYGAAPLMDSILPQVQYFVHNCRHPSVLFYFLFFCPGLTVVHFCPLFGGIGAYTLCLNPAIPFAPLFLSINSCVAILVPSYRIPLLCSLFTSIAFVRFLLNDSFYYFGLRVWIEEC